MTEGVSTATRAPVQAPPERAPAPLPLRLVTDGEGPARAPAPAPRVPPPPPAAIRRLALYAFEALEGVRSVTQLAGALTPEVSAALHERRAARTERRSLYKDQRRIVATPGPAHISHVSRSVVEAAVVLHAAGRTCAVALRFEAAGTRWRATHLTVM